MVLELAEVNSEHDFDELIPLLWLSYASPRVPYLWLTFAVTEDTPENKDRAIAMSKAAFKQMHKDDDTSHWLKVTDSDTGKIVAGSRWNIYDEGLPMGDPLEINITTWPEGDKREFANQTVGLVPILRKQRYKGAFMGPQMFFVHPNYRRRGVGKSMLTWGVDKADALGIQCFTESTPYAVPFYESAGFVVLHVDHPKTAKENASQDWQFMQDHFEAVPFFTMWRPIKGSSASGVKRPF